MAVKIGKYDERITIQRPEASVDRYGRHTNGWADYFSCFSHVMTYDVSEDGEAIIRFTDQVVFECRYCPELDGLKSNTCRIIYRGLAYDVKSIDRMNFGRNTIRFKAVTKGESPDG